MTNRVFTLWSAERGIGRSTLARRLCDYWLNLKESAVLVTIGADREISTPSLDAAQWVPRFAGLGADMVRNFLYRESDPVTSVRLREWPESKSLTSDLIALLRASFTRVVILSPLAFEPVDIAALDACDGLLWLTKPSALPSYDDGMKRLSGLHFSNAFSHLVLMQTSGGPVRGALAQVPKDAAPWRALTLASDRLAQTLDALPLSRPTAPQPSPETREQTVESLKRRVQPEVLKAFDEASLSPGGDSVVSDVAVAQQTVDFCLAQEGLGLGSREERHHVYIRVMDEILGLGPIEPLLKDPSITEVLVNGTHPIFIERKGKLATVDARFSSNTQLRTVIDRIVAPLGRRVDESSPLCDARLADGSRVNIVLPPLAIDGPTLTVRKFPANAMTFEQLMQYESLSKEMVHYLIRNVRGRQNMIISGGTGSGKTTLLNALSSAIPDDERIVTIEDAAELRLQKPHVVRLESRPPNAEGEGAVPIRRLVINALRMRPDRIVVGECRGGEALDMLQAMNTGHDGSLTTLHANTPRDALGRLETLVLMAGMDLPLRVVREQIRSAVHVIVQQARLPNGSRKIVSITELMGLEGDTLVTQEIFRFQNGRFEATGMVSAFTRPLVHA